MMQSQSLAESEHGKYGAYCELFNKAGVKKQNFLQNLHIISTYASIINQTKINLRKSEMKFVQILFNKEHNYGWRRFTELFSTTQFTTTCRLCLYKQLIASPFLRIIYLASNVICHPIFMIITYQSRLLIGIQQRYLRITSNK